MGFVNSIINVAIPLVPENGADSALMQRMIMISNSVMILMSMMMETLSLKKIHTLVYCFPVKWNVRSSKKMKIATAHQ